MSHATYFRISSRVIYERELHTVRIKNPKGVNTDSAVTVSSVSLPICLVREEQVKMLPLVIRNFKYVNVHLLVTKIAPFLFSKNY